MNLAKKANDLETEKKRADKLLFQMLPPIVATSLQRNKKVEAETYESITVYFSNIVAFDELAAESTPLQVRGHANSNTARKPKGKEWRQTKSEKLPQVIRI